MTCGMHVYSPTAPPLQYLESNCLLYFALLFALIGILSSLGLFVRPAEHPFLAASLYVAGFTILALLVLRSSQKPALLEKAWFIVLVGVVLRVAFLPQEISDDVYRYVWEGQQQLAGINPYAHAPANFAAEQAGKVMFEGMNHRDLPAAYPAVTMLTFRAMMAVSTGLGVPADSAMSLLMIKGQLILLDLLALVLLAMLLARERLPMDRLALYAWNPLVLLFVAGEGHFDGLQVLWLAVALLLLRHSRFAALGFVTLGLAILVKFFAILALPFLVTRKNWKWAWCVALPLCSYVPFAGDSTLTSLLVFAGEMHYNDLLPKVFRVVAGGWAPLVTVATLLAAFGATWLVKQDAPLSGIAICWMWLLAFLPTVHPWYAVPLAALLILRPSWPWLVFQMGLCATFWVLHVQLVDGVWREYPMVWLLVWGPCLVALWRSLSRGGQQLSLAEEPRSLDIVLPVRNEERSLREHLDSLFAAIEQHRRSENPWQVRVFMIDGKSTDRTCEIAREYDLTLLESDSCGRGGQMGLGVDRGEGDVVLMLHADSKVAVSTIERLVAKFANRPGLAWGILGHTYIDATPKMHVIELSNRLRFHLGGIAFGDQGMFLRRDVLNRVGMPRIKLMEDVELSLRLADEPMRASLGACLQVSTRRWEKKRFPGYTLQVLKLVSAYLLLRRAGTSVERLGARMYDTYYQS